MSIRMVPKIGKTMLFDESDIGMVLKRGMAEFIPRVGSLGPGLSLGSRTGTSRNFGLGPCDCDRVTTRAPVKGVFGLRKNVRNATSERRRASAVAANSRGFLSVHRHVGVPSRKH